MESSNQFYIDQGQKLRLLHEKSMDSFSIPDQIWQDSETKAILYVGDISCANSKKNLEKLNIYTIINC